MSPVSGRALGTGELLQRLQAVQYSLRRGDEESAWRSLLRTAQALYEQAARSPIGQCHHALMLGDRFRDLARQLSAHAAHTPSAGNPPATAPAHQAPQGNPNALAAGPTTPEPPPPLTLDDVVGQTSAKAQLRARYVYPQLAPELAARFGQHGGGGVLLLGLPGNGKTHLVRCLAGTLQAPTFVVAPSAILSKWLGEAERKLAEVFAAARRTPGALIFMDEIDAFAADRDRGNENAAMARLLAQLLVELDGFADPAGRLRFIGATNRPWAVDPALLRAGRFDALVLVDLPEAGARRTLLSRALATLPCAASPCLDEVVSQLEGYSAREVCLVAALAAQQAFVEEIESHTPCFIDTPHLLTAIERVHRSATPEAIARLRAFETARGLQTPTQAEAPTRLATPARYVRRARASTGISQYPKQTLPD